MNCKTTLRTLAVSTRDTLPADTAAHLQGCPTCSEAWRLDLQIREGLSTLPPAPPAPPDLLFALSRHLVERDAPHADVSLLAAAWRLGLPATVHVAVGTDIVHVHPACDPAAVGRTTHRDFLLFAGQVAELGGGGAYLNVGSAVLLPEVFLKAVTLARNLGHELRDFATANLDFIQSYRPSTNVVQRPTRGVGRGYSLTGHHELMLPLLAAALIEGAD